MRLSVIVTVYRTEPYLVRCIDSILNQTYKDIELIVVNDGSPGNVRDIVASYGNLITFVDLPNNCGLFRARLEGVKASSGEYIGFVDSDDFISKDYFRSLLHYAESNDVEIVAGTTVFNDDGYESIRNMHEFVFPVGNIYGDEVKRMYYRQSSSCYSWHTMWNKIYRRSLWETSMEYLDSIQDHIVMTEDLLYSSILFYYANSFAYVENEGYKYCKNETSSTGSALSFQSFKNNISTLDCVFNHIFRFLDYVSADKFYVDCLSRSKQYYGKIWSTIQSSLDPISYAKSRKILSKFVESRLLLTDYDRFFELFETKYNPVFEEIKKRMCNPNISAVSIDVFGVAVHPMVLGTHLYSLLDEKFEQLYPNSSGFSKYRSIVDSICASGESYATIDYRYQILCNLMSVDSSILKLMCDEEKKLLLHVTKVRKSILSLYNMLLSLGKTIIFVNDSCYPTDLVANILCNCGYGSSCKIYSVSSRYHDKKDLLSNIFKDLGLNSYCVAHLDDDWSNGYILSKELKMVSEFIPNSFDLFKGVIHGVDTGKCSTIVSNALSPVEDSESILNSTWYHFMLNPISNEYFDNPSTSFNDCSDFNANPRLIGSYLLGMHLLGISKFISSSVNRNASKNVVFLSRDGYLPKIAWDIVSEGLDVDSSYIFCSRKSLLPWIVDSIADLYDLPIAYQNHSPRSLMKLLSFCSNCSNDEINSMYEFKFKSELDYFKFIELFISKYYSLDVHNHSKNLCRKYLQKHILPDSIVFDMGYSGRIPYAIRKAIGYDVKFLYVYRDENKCPFYECVKNVDISVMYPNSPKISGFFREYLLSDYMVGTCEGYVERNDDVYPVFDSKDSTYMESYVLSEIQTSAIRFVKDYYLLYGDYSYAWSFNPYLVSLPFESFLISLTEFDRRIFRTAYSDDEVYGSTKRISVYDLWGWMIK